MFSYIFNSQCKIWLKTLVMGPKCKGAPSSSSNAEPDLIARTFKGGRRQRERAREELAQVDADIPNPDDVTLVGLCDFDSCLCKLLSQQWAWGFISAVQVQKYAAAAYEDEQHVLSKLYASSSSTSSKKLGSISLAKFAALGAHGSCPGNIAKELRLLLGEPRMPPVHKQNIITKILKPGVRLPQRALVSHSFLLPHIVFSYMYHHCRPKFNAIFLGNRTQQEMTTFWKTVIQRKDPRIIRHPMAQRSDWMMWAIALALHGDAVPVIGVGKSNTRSLDAYSMHGVWAVGSTIQIKVLLYSIFEQCKVQGHDFDTDTMQAVWRLLVWSFEVLFSGYHPKKDQYGHPWPIGSSERKLADDNTPLAGGYFGVIWLIKGDLDHYAKNLKIANYRTNKPCNYCPADRGADIGMQFTNFNDNASWKNMLYTSTSWLASLNTVHILFAVLSFLTGHNVEAGELHIIHLGTSQYLLGSVLWLLCYHLLPGTPTANMEAIWAIITNFYTKNKTRCQVSNITLSMFCDAKNPRKEYARLKTKGAETKHLVAAVLEVWNVLTRDVISDFIGPVRICLEQMCRIHDILDESRFLDFLEEVDAAILKSAVDIFLQAYSQAAHLADCAGLPLFTVAPKHHWFWHWADRSKYLNP